jgi:acyl carrier protein
MGLDLLDITFRVEKVFRIKVSREELFDLERNQDIVVGDLYELILKKLHLRDSVRHSVRSNECLWSQMQSALHSATGSPLEQIELGLPLKKLFPRETRRTRWEALRNHCLYRIRELDYPQFVRVAGFLLAALVVLIEQFQIWQLPGARWLWPLLGLIAIWMVGETYLKVLSVCAPLRTRFPSGMATVKDLCRSVLAANYADISSAAEVLSDDRSAAVWEQLVEILAEALGVDSAEVTFRSRLFGDLGAA